PTLLDSCPRANSLLHPPVPPRQRRPIPQSHLFLFSYNTPSTTELYSLSLHDALPIWTSGSPIVTSRSTRATSSWRANWRRPPPRSEEHTSELQSRRDLVCRLLLEKKKEMWLYSDASNSPTRSSARRSTLTMTMSVRQP